jgi:SAM-dependent methyltransferase
MNSHEDLIRRHWEERARQFGGRPEATLGEIPLRRLEIRTMGRLLRRYKPRRVLDVGCGNGYSTKIYAHRFPMVAFTGLDFSEEMIANAIMNTPSNCTFVVGDVLNVTSYPEGLFDLILTQRCLQNLPDYPTQRTAIENLLLKKSQDGRLLLMECSRDGVEKLNRLRQKLGRKPIEDIEPWHNHFMIDNDLISGFKAEVVHFSSTYMLLSKVIHPRLSLFACLLPAIGTFGYDKLYIIQ